jgi:hypothetical protein
MSLPTPQVPSSRDEVQRPEGEYVSLYSGTKDIELSKLSIQIKPHQARSCEFLVLPRMTPQGAACQVRWGSFRAPSEHDLLSHFEVVKIALCFVFFHQSV